MKKWDNLPVEFQKEEIKPYYEYLCQKQFSLILKRLFDILFSLVLLVLLSPLFLILSIWIKLDSKGPILFRQERVTQYGRIFRIHKFRTMVSDADKGNVQVTTLYDSRITKVGSKLRGLRLDEIPQLIDIFLGDMSFVGTRPEVARYVKQYETEMLATLLLPAGVTSEASITYKDEDTLLANSTDVNETYVKQILPKKMKYNLQYLKEFHVLKDLQLVLKTIVAVIK
ncbi:sugar transferase [Bulleidia sp. zg-1006]|uniref:sugar transferase n=1 Tax=Bacillati TaxID=1783272 RepID=UPI00351BF3D2